MSVFLRLFLLVIALAPTGLFAQSLMLRSTTTLPSGNLAVAATATNAYFLGLDNTNTNATYSLLVYDVQNPAAPVLLSSTPISAATTPAYNMLLIGSTLYASLMPEFPMLTSVTTRLVAIDVSRATAPVLRASVTLPGHWLELAAGPTGILCVLPTQMPPTASGTLPVAGELRLFNSQLQSLSVTPIPRGGVQVSAAGQLAYVTYAGATGPTYLPIDLSTPSAPVPQATTRPGALGVISGQLGFGLAQPDPYTGSQPGNTLLTYDVSNAAAPVLLSSYPLTQAGRFLQAAAGGVYTFLRTNPYYRFPSGGSGPLTAYLPSAGGTAPTVATPATPVASLGGGAAVGNRFYSVDGSVLRIYELGGIVTATRAAAATALPLYPNPAHGTLHLAPQPLAAVVTFYDVVGRPCLQASLPASGDVDISALPAGLYLVRTGLLTSKLVVK